MDTEAVVPGDILVLLLGTRVPGDAHPGSTMSMGIDGAEPFLIAIHLAGITLGNVFREMILTGLSLAFSALLFDLGIFCLLCGISYSRPLCCGNAGGATRSVVRDENMIRGSSSATAYSRRRSSANRRDFQKYCTAL